MPKKRSNKLCQPYNALLHPYFTFMCKSITVWITWHKSDPKHYNSTCCQVIADFEAVVTPMQPVSYQPSVYKVYSGMKVGVKPSSPLQNTLTFVVDLDSRSWLLRQLTSDNTGRRKSWKARRDQGSGSQRRLELFIQRWLLPSLLAVSS